MKSNVKKFILVFLAILFLLSVVFLSVVNASTPVLVLSHSSSGTMIPPGSNSQLIYNNNGEYGAIPSALYNAGYIGFLLSDYPVYPYQIGSAGDDITVGDPADAGASIADGQVYGYDFGGYTHTYRIYAYRNTPGGGRIYSNSYTEAFVTDDGVSPDYYHIDVSWSAPGGDYDGFRILKADDYNGFAFDIGFDTTDTFFTDDNSMWGGDPTVTPTVYAQVPYFYIDTQGLVHYAGINIDSSAFGSTRNDIYINQNDGHLAVGGRWNNYADVSINTYFGSKMSVQSDYFYTDDQYHVVTFFGDKTNPSPLSIAVLQTDNRTIGFQASKIGQTVESLILQPQAGGVTIGSSASAQSGYALDVYGKSRIRANIDSSANISTINNKVSGSYFVNATKGLTAITSLMKNATASCNMTFSGGIRVNSTFGDCGGI